MDDRDNIEMEIYRRLCKNCPRAKWCHDECEVCDEYAEILASALGEEYDN